LFYTEEEEEEDDGEEDSCIYEREYEMSGCGSERVKDKL
jgi:hypothetical protein